MEKYIEIGGRCTWAVMGWFGPMIFTGVILQRDGMQVEVKGTDLFGHQWTGKLPMDAVCITERG